MESQLYRLVGSTSLALMTTWNAERSGITGFPNQETNAKNIQFWTISSVNRAETTSMLLKRLHARLWTLNAYMYM